MPRLVVQIRVHELVRDAHRVVRVLAGDRLVRLAVEVARVAGGDHRADFPLLVYLPFDEVGDLGMIDVQADHLRRAPRRAAGFRSARPTIQNLEEAHEPGARAAAGELLVLRAELREIRPRAGAELEEPRLVLGELEYRHQVVGHGLDEARGALRMLV